MKLENKVALITGGNRGIGLATAELFAAEGARVMIAARDVKAGRAALEQVPGSLFSQCDVARAEDCQRAVDETVHAFGRLDILFNNAGIILRNRNVEMTSEEEWDATMDSSVKGTFLMSRAAMPHLRARGGSIVNTSSYLGLVGVPGLAAYCAAKGAIVNLTRAMALDHAKEKIRVNCICPGSVETDMIQTAWQAYENPAEAPRVWAAKHPMNRIASPQEIARVVLFLAGDDSSFITGAAVPIDGGITAG